MKLLHFPTWALLALITLTSQLTQAQSLLPSGIFQFTSGGLTNGANGGSSRVTVARVGGANGRVLVPYSGATNGTPA